MILKHKLLEKYKSYTFKIPVTNRDRIAVKAGDTVEPGVEMYRRIENNVKYSFYLPDQLNCDMLNANQYVTCIDGEFVKEGDELAQKTSMGGLTVKRLVSPANGIVDLSRLRMGYVDILGEEQEKNVKSTFKAKVLDVNPVDGIKIETSALALDLLSISQTEKSTISGNFVVLNAGKDIKIVADETSYEDKIVFVGKHLHTGLLRDLFEKGAKFVLTYSMDYQDFRNQGLPVGIIGGFGEIYSGQSILDELSKLNNSFVVVDFEEKQMFFLTNERNLESEKSIFVKTLVGSKIISHALGNYGMVGEIVGVEDNSYVTVEWEHNGRSVANIGTLEFIDY